MCIACVPLRASRRSLLGALSGIAASSLIGTAKAAAPTSNVATPNEALRLLKEGNARYVSNKPAERDFTAGRVARTFGQAPFASILGCADSRVAPEFAFDQSPGDLFVVRVAGNFLSMEGLASLEYGAVALGTKLIMVLGHSGCGAVKATIEAIKDNKTFPGHIDLLTQTMKTAIAPIVAEGGTDMMQRAVEANVRYTVKHLAEAHPVISDLVAKKRIAVVGGVYDLATGQVNTVST